MQNPYKTALTQAREDLVAVSREAKRITLRLSQLEALVAQLEAIIASSEPSPVPLFDSASVSVSASATAAPEPQVPLWKAIVAALNGQKSDFTVPDALKALERNGRIIESKNRLNILRNTLIQRSDIFGRLTTGHYCVRGFEGEVHAEQAEGGIES
jgi:hypothetical protein